MEFSRNILFCIFIILFWKFCSAKNFLTLDDEFKLFKTKFSRKYQNSSEEFNRKVQFAKNNRKIVKHNQQYNKGKHLYKMNHNQFSDRFDNEKNQILMKINYKNHTSNKRNKPQLPQPTTVPDSFNWIEKGWNTPVQNQGECGCCYAFSAVGTIEAAYFIKNGGYIRLSEQDIVDCSYTFNTNGCNGGYLEDVFEYVVDSGLSSEQLYPYKAEQEIYCLKSGQQTHITSYQLIQQGNENLIKDNVATIGPVAVTITANQNFINYSEGIYFDLDCDKNELNHNIIIVGYGKEGIFDYWIAKNSWGTTWGNQGYIKIMRNVNQCGIANYAALPIL